MRPAGEGIGDVQVRVVPAAEDDEPPREATGSAGVRNPASNWRARTRRRRPAGGRRWPRRGGPKPLGGKSAKKRAHA